ncbi:MAG TPA: DUF255 domain-containing protein [Gemmatimonadales bacterium]|nr:DUF255 domain-containing protein [Gemmatimonadales bacterium]
MAHSSTNYLTRAARQPVNWQPWGRDAFTLAAKLDRPVLLYIGSEVCRWCAETDRAIYTDPQIGALINALFVPIRVDRDERPDVAERYQSAVERLAGLHGWPLTVFLTADGAAFFGGTYFPADDPVTGRGLKQILPEVARSYRDQRSFVVQQAAMVRQLVLTGSGESRGVLYPSLVRQEIAGLRREVDEAIHAHAVTGSVMHAEAVTLLLAVSARERDTISLAVARRALDLMRDTAAGVAGEDPPQLVRAALAGTLAKAWVVTGNEQDSDLGRALVRSLARDVSKRSRDRVIFADQQAYVIESLMLAAATLGDIPAGNRARAALDDLLQRTYARGWGVRHGGSGASVMPAGSAGMVAGAPGTGAAAGLLQDQVQMASACLVAHQLTDDSRYLDVAIDLAGIMERAYADSMGGYYDTATPALLMPPPVPPLADRTKQFLDDVLPGANAAAARFLLHLAEVTGDARYRRRAQSTLEAFAGNVPGSGIRAATFLSAAWESMGSP